MISDLRGLTTESWYSCYWYDVCD